ncbi:MAG: hypothetical protein WBW31_15480 [Candidatus Sulfotelmatobacter sp.]
MGIAIDHLRGATWKHHIDPEDSNEIFLAHICQEFWLFGQPRQAVLARDSFSLVAGDDTACDSVNRPKATIVGTVQFQGNANNGGISFNDGASNVAPVTSAFDAREFQFG